jgi:hypothetical protein
MTPGSWFKVRILHQQIPYEPLSNLGQLARWHEGSCLTLALTLPPHFRGFQLSCLIPYCWQMGSSGSLNFYFICSFVFVWPSQLIFLSKWAVQSHKIPSKPSFLPISAHTVKMVLIVLLSFRIRNHTTWPNCNCFLIPTFFKHISSWGPKTRGVSIRSSESNWFLVII